jgi:hypothetical protein
VKSLSDHRVFTLKRLTKAKVKIASDYTRNNSHCMDSDCDKNYCDFTVRNETFCKSHICANVEYTKSQSSYK